MQNIQPVITTNFWLSGQSGSEYVQTNKNGTKYDLKFRVLELEEQGVITVADSIAYLTEEFHKDKDHLIKRFELVKKMDETMLAKEKRQSDIDKYKSDIAVMEYRIDSLKNLTPDNLGVYSNRNPKDILVQIIRCKYSVTISNGTKAEETFDFIFQLMVKNVMARKEPDKFIAYIVCNPRSLMERGFFLSIKAIEIQTPNLCEIS